MLLVVEYPGVEFVFLSCFLQSGRDPRFQKRRGQMYHTTGAVSGSGTMCRLGSAGSFALTHSRSGGHSSTSLSAKDEPQASLLAAVFGIELVHQIPEGA